MRKSELLLDKLSAPQNHPLYIAMQIYKAVEKETHVNDMIRKIQKKRRSVGNVTDEARILKAVGALIYLGRVSYYKGFIYRNAA